ncbi:MAG TPA: OpgC domain-containing protein, partial [Anaerolineae bacterium]
MSIFPSSHALIQRRGRAGDDQTDPFLLPWAGRPESASLETGRDAAVTVPPYITAAGRDLRLDVLRGLFVMVMVIDHVGGPSPVQWLTGGNRFFTSAAEGFILLSGVVAGLIYHRLAVREGLKSAVRKALGRAFTLYLLSVGLTLLMVPISEAFELSWAQGLDGTHPLTFVVGVLTLHRTYYLADVMLLYTLLFCLLPLPLFLMERGKTAWLLGVSWLIWGLYQIVPASATFLWPIVGNNLFAFSAWQALFVSGLVLGYRRDRLPALTYRAERRIHWVTGVLTLGLIGLYLLMQRPAAALPAALRSLAADGATGSWLLQTIFAKTGVQPGRIVASAVVLGFFFLSLTRWWPVLGRRLEPVFAPLGRSALYAFTVHVAVVVLVALILVPFGLSEKEPAWLNALLQVAAVALIWFLVRRQFLAPTPSSLRYWRRSPALMAVVALVLLPWLPLAPVQAQTPAAASVAGVSAAVLARARAYGTPVASVQRAAAAQTPAAEATVTAGQPGPATTSGTRTSDPPTAAPVAPTGATPTPAGAQKVAPVRDAVADPV